MDTETRYLANVFSKKPVVITHGKGVALGHKRKGIRGLRNSAVALGHCHPKIVEAIKLVEQPLICHSCYYNDKRRIHRKTRKDNTKGLDKAFLPTAEQNP